MGRLRLGKRLVAARPILQSTPIERRSFEISVLKGSGCLHNEKSQMRDARLLLGRSCRSRTLSTVGGAAFGNNYLAVAFFFFDCGDVFAFFPGLRLGTHSGSFKVLSQASHAVTSRFSFSGSFKARFVFSPISSLRL